MKHRDNVVIWVDEGRVNQIHSLENTHFIWFVICHVLECPREHH